MRIIGGRLSRREIKAPKTTKTRPITDKDREALFNILGDIEGLRVLDAYAGSGALGLEALSRGASFVDGVEIGKEAASVIVQNVDALGVGGQYNLHQQKLASWVKTADTYDLIFADPPFDALELSELEVLIPHVVSGGMMVLKHSSKAEVPEFTALSLLESRNYGDTVLSFYRRA